MAILPSLVETERLVIRRPREEDAPAIFRAYASDPEVTRYLSWRTHRSLDDARAFVAWCERDWVASNGGSYVLLDRASGVVVGGTGLTFETPYRASTGYVLARDAWGRGLATEALGAMVAVAFAQAELHRLYLLCHHEHAASARVAEKCGFVREGTLRGYLELPNLGVEGPQDVLCYARLRGD